MATTTLRGNQIHTVGELPSLGATAPSFTLTGRDFADVTSEELTGSRVIVNIFPSIDTGVCSASVRTFNKLAADLENTRIVCASADLPFALNRFCGAEGIENVTVGSSFRSSFGTDFGVTIVDGPWRGLLARSVVVYDVDGSVLHTQVVDDIGHEPDYDAAIAALG
jgi:thioredoxin-dependent peroxiredoxin